MKDCKDCKYHNITDECITCTIGDDNFEPKEKKMKVTEIKKKEYEVVTIDNKIYLRLNIGHWFDYLEQCIGGERAKELESAYQEYKCKPVQEGWLTEEQADEMIFYAMKVMKIEDMCSEVKNRIKDDWKKQGWIKQSKTAMQELEEKYIKLRDERQDMSIFVFEQNLKEYHDLAIKALEAEKK